MKNKNEQGFALVLSLVLMLAMSLMGGALIVISAGDHKSNNNSDEYQQTFYVAETALLEGEKYVLDRFLGPWNTATHKRDTAARSLPANQTATFNGTLTKKLSTSDKYYFNTSTLSCFNSFPDKIKLILKLLLVKVGILEMSFEIVFITTSQEEKQEAETLKGYYYEYFITRIGAAPFKGYRFKCQKTSTDTGNEWYGL